MSIAACPSMRPAIPRSACARASSTRSGVMQTRKQQHEQHDHDRAADELGQRELPADQHPQDDTKFQHQIGRGELERHGSDEIAALAEDRPRQRDGGIGTRGGRGAEPTGDARSSASGCQAAAGASRLWSRRPARHPTARSPGPVPTNLPPHGEGHRERGADCGEDAATAGVHDVSLRSAGARFAEPRGSLRGGGASVCAERSSMIGQSGRSSPRQ